MNVAARAVVAWRSRSPSSKEGSISDPSCHSFQLVIRAQSAPPSLRGREVGFQRLAFVTATQDRPGLRILGVVIARDHRGAGELALIVGERGGEPDEPERRCFISSIDFPASMPAVL